MEPPRTFPPPRRMGSSVGVRSSLWCRPPNRTALFLFGRLVRSAAASLPVIDVMRAMDSLFARFRSPARNDRGACCRDEKRHRTYRQSHGPAPWRPGPGSRPPQRHRSRPGCRRRPERKRRTTEGGSDVGGSIACGVGAGVPTPSTLPAGPHRGRHRPVRRHPCTARAMTEGSWNQGPSVASQAPVPAAQSR